MFSFESPFSPEGLFVNLKSWQGFSIDYVGWDAEKTGTGAVYLLQKWTKVKREEAMSEDAEPASVAIGVVGGFLTEEQKWETRKEHFLVLADAQGASGVAVPFPNDEIPEYVATIATAILTHSGAATQTDVSAWEAMTDIPVSKYAEALIQLDNGKKISPDPKTWKCEESGMTENLWLNLSTGYIGSGRANWDGTGGTGAALKHYTETGGLYPLVVKLGTITASGADVYSYAPDEDTLVQDPKLANHMAHWGINIMQLEKTDKTMAEMEVELNKSFEFSKITESGKALEPVSGPGYTGIINLGNSCYMNSVMQCLISLPEVQLRYQGNAQIFFQTSPEDPTQDFLSQMAKLTDGLHSGKYCTLPDDASEEAKANALVVAPRMFKSLVGKGHPEFSSGRQQDAAEYIQHLFEFMSRAEFANAPRMGGEGQVKPSSQWFEFLFEDRLHCAMTNSFKYVAHKDNMLSLNIPLEEAINLAAVNESKELVQQKLSEAAASGVTLDRTLLEEIKPIIPLQACLDRFFSSEPVEDFYSPLAGQNVTAQKQTRFKTFPRYLILQMKRYFVDENWMAKKLEVLVDVPENLDIQAYRSTGPLDTERLMPEDAVMTEALEPTAHPETLANLLSMGFSENGCKRACLATGNTVSSGSSNADAAMNWIFEHMNDPDFNEPPVPVAPKNSEFVVDPETVSMLSSMGFTEGHVRSALKATQGNAERAADWLFSHIDSLDAAVAELEGASNETGNVPPPTNDEDGTGNYTLHGFISHIGRNTGSGHYVCHIRKDGRWVIFDDQKVAFSQDPPLQHGYLYIFRRDDAPTINL